VLKYRRVACDPRERGAGNIFGNHFLVQLCVPKTSSELMT
jgi:hypothetical protein